VVIDPGHNGANHAHSTEINRPVDAGGFDKACNTTGTAGDGYAEAQFNWDVATALRDALARQGATVVLTRQDNEGWGPCIDERGLTASQAGADLLISIHADGASTGERGFHVIHPGPVPGYTDDIVGPSADAAVVVRDALVAAGLEVSTYAGSNGLVQRTDLGTLNRAGTPAVMVEAGNMRDPADLARLRALDGQGVLVAALASGITDYLTSTSG
jgi:N-acetylmuramoyl-L-alanine amidase